MPLYRLDYVDEQGAIQVSVANDIDGRDFLSHHMQTARSFAKERATATGWRVLITRIGNAGQLRPSLVILPDGSALPPATAKKDRNTCMRDTQRVCFCPSCRAARRESRS
jgi:hypothetical protein